MGKMFAPTFFALLFIALIAVYLRVILMLPIPIYLKIVIGAGLAAIGIAMGYVLLKRYREVEEEDPDDLSKY